MQKIIINAVGWYGVVAIIGAYAAVSFGWLTAHGLAFQLLNFTGALGVVIETYSKKDYQPFWLNVVWVVIALVAISNIVL